MQPPKEDFTGAPWRFKKNLSANRVEVANKGLMRSSVCRPRWKNNKSLETLAYSLHIGIRQFWLDRHRHLHHTLDDRSICGASYQRL